LVPVAALGVSSVIGLLPHWVGSASAGAPTLPPLTPAQLIDKVRSSEVRALSGTLSLTANLGLPSLGPIAALGGAGSATSIASLVSGSHTARVWIDGAEHLRVATIAPMAETNWIRNGADVWTYDSDTLSAMHYRIPDHVGRGDDSSDPTRTSDPSDPAPPNETPQDLAKRLLDRITPTTQVSIESTDTVAGQDVYRLVLSPDDAHSTIGRVIISVDAANGLPLDVTITTRSTGATAIELGFTSVSFATPSASEFEFTPPPGATVTQATTASQLLSTGARLRQPHQHRHGRKLVGATGVTDPTTRVGGVKLVPPSTAGGATRMIGKDWESAAVLSGGSLQTQLGTLLQGAASINVGSQQARVVETGLLTILVLDDGRIAVGAVDASTLASIVAGA
jgi:outer membrane lipoprotein-sorting protein